MAILPKAIYRFDAIVNGIVFLISLSIGSLLVYRKATYFSVLILYRATLLCSNINSSSFVVESLGFFYVQYHIISVDAEKAFDKI